MKLYKIILWDSREKLYDFQTRFASTQEEVKPLIRGRKDFEIWEVELKDKITKTDLILLLEGDSPGQQPLVMTPSDLIVNKTLIRKKEPKDAAT
jgi:hypothetical protein